ncbi:MAG: aminotransferase class V-fold PLP-dependent enzyme [Vicinamibacterales bacterium]
MTFGRPGLGEWPLDPAITYLNHGTVGVTPLRVLAAQREIREAIERQPARFLLRELTAATGSFTARGLARPRLREAASAVAEFLGARGDDLVFVDNATTGAGAVLRSFPFEPGDEILLSDLAYGGIVRAATYAAREKGASIRMVGIPYPFSTEGIVRAFEDGVSPATRLAVVDHVSAESALVLPLAEIARRLRGKGVAILADGAHAPGAIPVGIEDLGVDWYTANLHKWAWAPRSSGILWVRPDRQSTVRPLVESWGLDLGFNAEFDWPGTRDPSPYLAAPAAIALLQEWGLETIRAYNHQLAWSGAKHLADRWQTEWHIDESLIGTMATVGVPHALGTSSEQAQVLRDRLLYEDRIEVQVHSWRNQICVRISAQIYNDMEDVERLAAAVVRAGQRTS